MSQTWETGRELRVAGISAGRGAERGEEHGHPELAMDDYVPFFRQLPAPEQARLLEMGETLRRRNMPPSLIASSLRSTAEVLREMRSADDAHQDVFRRAAVQRFIEQNAVADPFPSGRHHPRKERKREERDRLQAHTLGLLREARGARARHEVKKTRNMLLKVDQRELRRMLGREGDELCRQINTWLRSTAAMF